VAVDVAAPDACARLDSALASMPPLAGIVHAAGVVADAPLHAHDDDRMATVLAPKVDGAWNLHRLSATRALDFFVAFSSAASLIGSSGQAAYAAANAFLDALAYHRRTLGLPAVCINWGPWGGAGMATTDLVRQRLARRGITPLDPGEALSVFRSALAPDAPVRFGVLTADWPTFARQFPRGPSRYFERVAGMTKEIATAPVEIAALPRDARGSALQALVREHCAAVLGFANPSDIGSTDTFRDIGLDSLTAVELASRLETVLGLPIPRTLPLDNGSVEAMSVRLATLLETA
jgi:acyl carrier protein